jgi:hypothetical protein
MRCKFPQAGQARFEKCGVLREVQQWEREYLNMDGNYQICEEERMNENQWSGLRLTCDGHTRNALEIGGKGDL